jgi:hypothetical protein
MILLKTPLRQGTPRAHNVRFVAGDAETEVVHRGRHEPSRTITATRAPLVFAHLQDILLAGIRRWLRLFYKD